MVCMVQGSPFCETHACVRDFTAWAGTADKDKLFLNFFFHIRDANPNEDIP